MLQQLLATALVTVSGTKRRAQVFGEFQVSNSRAR
jgi:hypothetical protein